jgi:tryptophan halogenase
MVNLVNKVIILGGGSSAWLTAAYLNHQLPKLSITLIDKEIGSPVGVGEGTILNFEPFLNGCGFKKEEWFNEIDAVYKAGILFPGFLNKKNEVWHPFDLKKMSFDDWSKNQKINFKEDVIGKYNISVKEKNVLDDGTYAYHVDCSKLVQFIQKKLKDKIKVIKSEMTSFSKKDNLINSLKLKNGKTIKGDLFIDCTGFKSLLNKKPKRNDLKGRLICNTAIAGHIPYKNKSKELNPYVISEAVDHGWVWNIPVQSRIGSGLVFNRDITDIDVAKKYFLNYWDNRTDESKLKVIDWTPYYNDNMWQDNVVAIGLSAGFIEPLESTGLALIMQGVHQLTLRISDNYYTDYDIKVFNSNLKNSFEECIDFINMHYTKTERKEEFWKVVKSEIKMSDKQKFYIEYLKNSKLSLDFLDSHSLQDLNVFTPNNWFVWLVQMGFTVKSR